MAIYKAITKGKGKLSVGHAQPDKGVQYLLYEQEENGEYRRDEKGELIRRTEHATALNAEVDTFCEDCRDYAAEFKVNQRYEDLKYKHYIQGFSAPDSELLTKDECHRMGVEFAKTFFPDFPVLIVTHFEQCTEIGGAHWHNHFYVYNCNVHNGRKLDTSGERMREQKRYIITQALAHGLSDKELRMQDGRLLPSTNPDRVSSAEYYDRKYHQKLLDREKKLHPNDRTKQHTYYTQLQELRIVVATAVQAVGNDQYAFRDYLRRVYGVETKIVRGGEFSYLHPDRAKADGTGWVRGRTLGNAYTWEAINNGTYQSHYRRITGSGDPSQSADGADRRADTVGATERVERDFDSTQISAQEAERFGRDSAAYTALSDRENRGTDQAAGRVGRSDGSNAQGNTEQTEKRHGELGL